MANQFVYLTVILALTVTAAVSDHLSPLTTSTGTGSVRPVLYGNAPFQPYSTTTLRPPVTPTTARPGYGDTGGNPYAILGIGGPFKNPNKKLGRYRPDQIWLTNGHNKVALGFSYIRDPNLYEDLGIAYDFSNNPKNVYQKAMIIPRPPAPDAPPVYLYEEPTTTTTRRPVYQQPQPVYQAPAPAPVYQQPPAPPQPVYQQPQQPPVYQQPPAPVYQQPQPVYQAPAPAPVYQQSPAPPAPPQPVYQQPQPVYQAPDPVPVYQQPAPAQPVYQQPQAPPVPPAPVYQQPVQSGYGA